MGRQSKAQREYMRDVRIRNSINYAARTTMPRQLRNIYIVTQTMRYNELDDNPKSAESRWVKAVNTGLLAVTIIFEVLVAMSQVIGFVLTGGKTRRRYRRRW